MDKQALLSAIIAELENELHLLSDAANSARDEATNEESRAEDRFDMRSQSAAYLAAGQARMAGETADAIEVYRSLHLRPSLPEAPIAIGSLVALEANGRRSWFFIGPLRGGLELSFEERSITVLTGASPLGHQLMGKRRGDFVLLPGKPKPVQHSIVQVL